MAQKKRKISFLWDRLSPATRMALFIGGSVSIIIIIIVGICFLQMRPEEKKPNHTNGGLDKDLSILIGENDGNEGFYKEYFDLDMDIGQIFSLYKESVSYYHECTVTAFGDNGTKFERVKRVLRDGDKYNIRTYNKNTLIETIKCDGKDVVIINETTGKANKISLSEFARPIELASMPSHENLLSLLKEYEENKENATLSDATFEISRSRDMNVLEIVIKYRASSVVERYRYYLNYGIIYSCESGSDNGETKIYSMNTTYFDRNISNYISDNSFNVN